MNVSLFLTWAAFAFVLSVVGTYGVLRLAMRFGIVDAPDGEKKRHGRVVPLLGGIGPYLSIAICVLALLASSTVLTSGAITVRHYVGVLLGGLILMIGGALDDRYTLPPRVSFLAPLLAAVMVIACGVEVSKLTNPFGGVLLLSSTVSAVLVFVWLLACMYAMKLLDGIDGLTTSVGSVGAFMVMMLSLTQAYFQPDVAMLAAVCLSALLGFLVWNLPPARMFLGEGGSTFVGFFIGILAVISGGKLAVAVLCLGLPIMDVVIVALGRWYRHGWRAVVKGDRTHLHHRLKMLGWSDRRIVGMYTAVALAFGGSALFLQSGQKLLVFALLAVCVVIAAVSLVSRTASYE